MKANEAVSKVYLKDYKPHDFKITHINLCFELDPKKTLISSKMSFKKQNIKAKDLFLNGEDLALIEVKMDGQVLKESEYKLEDNGLRLFNVTSEEFELSIKNEISPESNTLLEGLYQSDKVLCTQNEPEGFRHITYFIDRPDNMAVYKTKIIANKKDYPVLLSNGNCIDQGELSDGRHWTEWEDPFPKPSYLFALVAGDLGMIADEFKTRSGKVAKLFMYCDPGDEQKCEFAMESLKKAMKWDEERFGLEYDLNEFRVVSVGSFNMGAMENKALNVFNSALILANQKTATDGDYLAIESVIGHEYFHNWTGNRVTCRDWFQLTLKEGLTVFRDQEFSADLNSRPVQRILDVRRLREAQFPEDASPMAHPIRPTSYAQIDNFYTATVYEKGAEVIRMIHTLVGEEGFQQGIKKYFELFDGQAVTTDDFLHAMKEANPHLDIESMKNWYTHSGTPVVEFNETYDADKEQFKLAYKQTCSSSTQENEGSPKPFFIPIKLGFIGKNGEDLTSDVQVEQQAYWKENVVVLKNPEGEITFDNLKQEPVVSLNRSFSAPVKLKKEMSLEQQLHILKYDVDHFNRYESSQNIFTEWISDYIEKGQNVFSDQLANAYKSVINDSSIDNHMKALLVVPPSEGVLHQSQNPIDFKKTLEARQALVKNLAEALEEDWKKSYKAYGDLPGAFDAKIVGDREFRNTCLGYLACLGEKNFDLVKAHFENADNMTDQYKGILLLNKYFTAKSKDLNQSFYKQWKSDNLVLQKWIRTQTLGTDDKVYDRIKEIQNLPEYKQTVPNFVRALWGSFTRNFVMFHNTNGKGYEIVTDQIIELDKINRNVAAAITKAFRIRPSVSPKNREMMDKNLNRILKTQGISDNVAEVAEQILNAKT